MIGVCKDGSLYFGPATADPAAWATELKNIILTLMESPTLLRAAAGDPEAAASLPEEHEVHLSLDAISIDYGDGLPDNRRGLYGEGTP